MESLIRKIEELEKLANGSKTSRLFYNPANYIQGQFFSKIIYPNNRKGLKKDCQTFFDTSINILLPAGLDIYILGGKSHDSEIRLAKFLIKKVKPGDTFLDIGAHFGYYSLLVAKLVGHNGKVISIEAASEIFQVLQKNINPLTNCSAYNWACTAQNEAVTFYEFPLLYSEYNTLKVDQFENDSWIKHNPPTQKTISGKNLNYIQNQLNVYPDIIKIDVEGAELDIILGGNEMLQQSRPIVAMEFLAKTETLELYQHAFKKMMQHSYSGNVITASGELKKIESHEIAMHFKAHNLDSDNIIFTPTAST
jgi:FkbM family methyltransferase